MREAFEDCGDVREAFEDCGDVREGLEDCGDMREAENSLKTAATGVAHSLVSGGAPTHTSSGGRIVVLLSGAVRGCKL